MSLIEPILQELEKEAKATRRAIERIPDGKLGWKPHDKSMSMGALAWHLAGNPLFVAQVVQVDRFDFAKDMGPWPEAPATTAEIVAALDGNLGKAKGLLAPMSDERLLGFTELAGGEKVYARDRRVDILRTILLNHWYHHRGQLTVYLRMLDLPVPGIYGPSADEGM